MASRNPEQKELDFRGITFVHSAFYPFQRNDKKSIKNTFIDIVSLLNESLEFKNRKHNYFNLYSTAFLKDNPMVCFEYTDGIRVNDFHFPSGTKLEGAIRIFVTVYNCGFILISSQLSIYSSWQKGMKSELKKKHLLSCKPLSKDDIIYLIENQFHKAATNFFDYVSPINEKREGNIEEIENQFITYLQKIGISVDTSFKKHCRSLSIWNTPVQFESIGDLLKKYPDVFFFLLTTPVNVSCKYDPKRVKDTVSKCFTVSSKEFAFSFEAGSLITIYNQRPKYDGMKNTLLQQYILLNLQDYSIRFFASKVKKIVRNLSENTTKVDEKILSKINQLRSRFVSFMNDFYWIRADIRLHRPKEMLEAYQQKFAIQNQIKNLRERINDISNISEEMRKERTQRTLNAVLLLFSIFSLAQVITELVVWYFDSLLLGRTIPLEYFLKSSSIPFIMVIVLFIIFYRYIWQRK